MMMKRTFSFGRLCAAWSALVLLLAVSCHARAADSCSASFTHGGDVAKGLTFSASRTVSGLSAGNAIEQFKRIAAAQGFSIGRDHLRRGRGELVISQLPSINARGFDLHVVADASGAVTLSTTLPAGMDAKPDAFRSAMCEALNQLGQGSAAPSQSEATAAAPVFAPSPKQRTDLCLANFMSQGTSIEGQTYSTWSIGMAMDTAASMASIKRYVKVTPGARVTTEIRHGNKASLMLSFAGLGEQGESPDSNPTTEGRAIPIRIELDGALDAASFTAHFNPEQQIIGEDPLRYIACTMIAAALDGAPIPPTKKASRFHFRNPFKNEQKAAQKKYDEQIALMRSGRDLLYSRAVRAGKAIVFLPMLNIDHKYAQAGPKSLTPGGEGYPSFRFDQTANLIWHAAEDHDDLIKVGSQVTLFQEGLFGSIQTIDAGKSRYGVYIADPGRYELAGLTYQLPHTTLPSLSSKHWTENPRFGSATFVITRNAEFHDSQAWFDARYQNVTVDDGSYCTVTWTPGSTQGCANWQNSYHTETRLADPGGWRTVTEKGYAGGLAVSVKLEKSFARFEAKAGQVLVTDGFAATPESLNMDPNACHQAGENLIHCALHSLTLFRIPGSKADLVLSSASAKKVPLLASLMAKVQYQPVILNAKRLPEVPGTYEAAWAVPFRAPAR